MLTTIAAVQSAAVDESFAWKKRNDERKWLVTHMAEHGRHLHDNETGKEGASGEFTAFFSPLQSTVLVLRMAHRIWKETKQQPSMLPS